MRFTNWIDLNLKRFRSSRMQTTIQIQFFLRIEDTVLKNLNINWGVLGNPRIRVEDNCILRL